MFGLGYVGCVTGACLAKVGHTVWGVDVSAPKVGMVNAGRSPVLEKGLERLIGKVAAQGKLRATLDPAQALRGADVSLVAVGTPSRPDGNADLDPLDTALRSLGRALRGTRKFHVVVVRSTIPPGSMDSLVVPTLERAARKRAKRDFGVCFHPEFLREGSSIRDFFHPAKTIIGASDPRSAKRLMELWKGIKAPVFITSYKEAEILKYVDNTFHALKVCFANEMGSLCKRLGVDGQRVMKIFVQDTKLNISPLYLRPGLPFGGPCLPKDVRAFGWLARSSDLRLPLIQSILPSNSCHLDRAVQLLLGTRKKRFGVLGLAFKSDTDDVRESPVCLLVKKLLQARTQVRLYDPRVRLDRLVGANRAFLEKELPSLPGLMTSSLEELLKFSETVVLAGSRPEFELAVNTLKGKKAWIDLAGFLSQPGETE